MKKELKLMAVAALAVLAASCSSAQKMVDEANNVKVTCNPAVLEAVAGNVDADLTVTYPAKYFLPKAVLEVTPVLVYNGGEAKMSPLMYQGQKVKDNYKVVSKDGGIVNEKDMYEALKEGRIGGYASDVMENELAGSGLTGNDEFASPLFECENFIITPHLGAQSVDASRDIGIYITGKVKDLLGLNKEQV